MNMNVSLSHLQSLNQSQGKSKVCKFWAYFYIFLKNNKQLLRETLEGLLSITEQESRVVVFDS